MSRSHVVLTVALVGGLWGCGSGGTSPATSTPSPTVAMAPLPDAADERALLDAVFRIDVERVEAAFDVYPSERRVSARAAVRFRMRPGQTRPLVHFEPAQAAGDVVLALDGATIDTHRTSDVRLVSFEGSPTSLEIQRELPPGVSHLLEASYALPMPDPYGRFFANVNDIEGRGNEGLFPTLNTPHELAQHALVFRVHGTEPYVGLGSGSMVRTDAAGLQEWVLDTEREVASYTVMFHLAPARDSLVSERRIQGVDVRVLAPVAGVTAEEAFAQLDPWLDELQGALGSFPMPRGLSVVLTQSGGGMEYYGATTTSLRALRHEVFHMYYGCSTVARTYRDSWWDEAIDMWYELSKDPAFPPIPEEYRSNIVSGRSPVAVGFDRRAYDEGARVMQAMTRDLGGRDRMVAFLADLHRRRSFDPFGTWDLADELASAGGADVRARFGRWLYGETALAAAAASPWEWLHHVDLTPPDAVRRRHAR